MIAITSGAILISAWWIGQRYSLTMAEQQLQRADYYLHSYLESQADLLNTSIQGIVTDYGFRETVANGDPDTIHSMVENHARRVGLDFLAITNTGGELLASLAPLTQQDIDGRLTSLLNNLSAPPRIAALAGQFYWLVTTEIKAPHPVGISIAGIAIDQDKLEHAHAITGLDITLQSASQPYSVATRHSGQANISDSLITTLIASHRQRFIHKELILSSQPQADVSLYLTADLRDFHQRFDRFSLNLLLLSGVLVSLISLFTLLLSRRMFMPVESLHKKLLYRASHDDLTGLHNRVTVNEQLNLQITEAQRKNSSFFVALLDIDHFKQINDSYGHSAGDSILTHVAFRLKSTLREYDVVGRYGGEEFIVFANDELASCEARLLRLKQAISTKDFSYKNHSITLTISIGACFIDFERFQAPLSPETLVELADQALYDAKSQGRNRVVIQHHSGQKFTQKVLC